MVPGDPNGIVVPIPRLMQRLTSPQVASLSLHHHPPTIRPPPGLSRGSSGSGRASLHTTEAVQPGDPAPSQGCKENPKPGIRRHGGNHQGRQLRVGPGEATNSTSPRPGYLPMGREILSHGRDPRLKVPGQSPRTLRLHGHNYQSRKEFSGGVMGGI